MGAPPQFAEVLALQRESGRPMYEIERERLGTTHAEVGAFLLGSWGLPLTMFEVVAYHHTPQSATEASRPVHVADALVDEALYIQNDAARDQKLDLTFLEAANLTNELPRWRALAATVTGG